MRPARAIALLAAVLLAAPSALAQPTDVGARARAAFQRGVDEMEAERWQPALDAFNESIELRPTQVALLNAGRCLEGLHRPREALQAYERFLREFARDATRERRAVAEERIRELRATMGLVRLAVDADGAEVSVDGEVVGRSPLAEPLLLPAGTHALVARAEGRPETSVSATVRAGETTEVTLRVPPATPPPPAEVEPPPPASAPAPSPARRDAPPAREGLSPGWFWTTAGLAAAGAVATGILGAVVIARDADYRDSVPRTRAARSSGRDLVHVTDATFGVAVLAAIGAVILYTQTDFGGAADRDAAAAGSPRLDVAGGTTGATVRVSGSF